MAATLLELGLMGRPTIHNGAQPSCIRWDSLYDIEAAIQECYEERHEVSEEELQAISDGTRRHMTVPANWQDPEFWQE